MRAPGYEVQGHYAYGWEAVTAEDTKAEALATKRIYEENEPGTAFRVKKEKSDADTK